MLLKFFLCNRCRDRVQQHKHVLFPFSSLLPSFLRASCTANAVDKWMRTKTQSSSHFSISNEIRFSIKFSILFILLLLIFLLLDVIIIACDQNANERKAETKIQINSLRKQHFNDLIIAFLPVWFNRHLLVFLFSFNCLFLHAITFVTLENAVINQFYFFLLFTKCKFAFAPHFKQQYRRRWQNKK